MPRLCVNVDHVATVRQARRATEPDPVRAAILAEMAGAEGIVIHVREDRRHAQDRDLKILRHVVETQLNLEMAPIDEMVDLAQRVKPDLVTLVPEKREEVTTEGGLDVEGQRERLGEIIDILRRAGIIVSLFITPEMSVVKLSSKLNAHMVELHTGHYANATTAKEQRGELDRIANAAALGRKIGLGVAAGHGLDYRNVGPVARIPEVRELNIGHSIIARAVLVGIHQAVAEMARLIQGR
ncbi:MAG: pyridoxine 5'-phosphate synthase [Candidatus Eisenbacteria sp.]|nr:pyridoxine 5'-phosphate synthase [Candidatus Eisenbacteria bacterium]